MPVVAITGASGFLGSRLAQFMGNAGWEVRRLQRDVGPSERFQDAGIFRFVLGEPIEESTLRGVAVLVHCAYDYEAHGTRDDVNLSGAKELFRHAAAAGIDHIVFVSSMHAFDGCRSRYGRTKRAIEDLTSAHAGSVVRPGTLFDTSGTALSGGVRGNTLSQIQRLTRRLPVVPVPASRAATIYLTHLDDLCSLILEIAGGTRSKSGQPIVAANSHPYTLQGLFQAIRMHAEGKRLTVVPVPWRLAWFVVWLAEHAGVRTGIRSESIALLFDQDPAPRFAPLDNFSTQFRRL